MITITLEPTPQIVRLSARPARVWIGKTASGVPVQALVATIVVESTEEDQSTFERELIEQSPLGFYGIDLGRGADALASRAAWEKLCHACGLPLDHTTTTIERVAKYVGELQARIATLAPCLNAQAFERYKAQCLEWDAIRDELIAAAGGHPVTAHQVTTEQHKRFLSRGERPVTLEDLSSATTEPLPDPTKDPNP
jgi:hypothetical protein